MNTYWKITGWLILALLLSLAQAPAWQERVETRAPQPTAGELAWQSKVDTWVLEQAADGPAEFILYLGQQADLTQARQMQNRQDKGEFVYQQLSYTARQTQKPLLEALEQWAARHPGSVEYRSYWVVNMIWVRGDVSLLERLAQRPEVVHVVANPSARMDEPEQTPLDLGAPRLAPQGVEWNIAKVGAPDVWAAGFTGQGVVIGGQDTGYAWEHAAIKRQYRGWDGTTADHNYNWHDAIHSGGGSCGADSPVPCDDNNHGTHTMGTMVGDDGAGQQIGMAPGARWIGCRNMNKGVGSPVTYTECFQWFIAPTDLNDQNPRPDLAPQVINNSWSCPENEGCVGNEITLINQVVDNVRAAGILTVQSAGNEGYAGCGSIADPAAIYDSSFTVGNTMSNDQIAAGSSRGPATVNGVKLLKPDISAPGTGILSSIPGGYQSMSGTSMAGPHVAGLAALLISAKPSLAGHPDQLESIIEQSAVHLTTSESCGDVPGSQVPNNTFGWGRIDAAAAVLPLIAQRLEISATASDVVVAAGATLTYTIRVTNTSAISPTTQVQISAEIPASTTLISATQPLTQNGQTLTWAFPVLNPGQSVNVSLAVQVNAQAGQVIISQNYSAAGTGVSPVSGEPLTTPVIANGAILYMPLVGKTP